MSLVILAVDGESELKEWLSKLDTKYKSHFEEPYWENRMTAVVAYGSTVQEQVKELRLL